MAGNVSALRQLAQWMLSKEGSKFLKPGTRPLPANKQELVDQAAVRGIKILGSKPMPMEDVAKRVLFRTDAPSKHDRDATTRVEYTLDYLRPSDLPNHTMDLPVAAHTDEDWIREFIVDAPKERRYSILNAMSSDDAAPGTGAALYPFVMDYQMLDPSAMNLVTQLTKENLRRFPRNQIPQYIRTGGEWAHKQIPTYDLFKNPLAEMRKDPEGRLESLLGLYEEGVRRRLAPYELPYIDDIDSMSAADAVSELRRMGAEQIGEDTVRHMRGINALREGREGRAAEELFGRFKCGGLASLKQHHGSPTHATSARSGDPVRRFGKP